MKTLPIDSFVFQSPQPEPVVLFTSKPDYTLRFCVYYRGSDAIMIKNWYVFLLIDRTFDCFSSARVFIKIDVKNVYYCLWIWEDDKEKIAFQTRYRLFEYLMMLFGLTNSPASFQSYIHGILRLFFNITVIV